MFEVAGSLDAARHRSVEHRSLRHRLWRRLVELVQAPF